MISLLLNKQKNRKNIKEKLAKSFLITHNKVWYVSLADLNIPPFYDAKVQHCNEHYVMCGFHKQGLLGLRLDDKGDIYG